MTRGHRARPETTRNGDGKRFPPNSGHKTPHSTQGSATPRHVTVAQTMHTWVMLAWLGPDTNSSMSAKRFVLAKAYTSSVSTNVSRAFRRAICRNFTSSSQLSAHARQPGHTKHSEVIHPPPPRCAVNDVLVEHTPHTRRCRCQ